MREGEPWLPYRMGLRDKPVEDAVKARFAVTLLALLALVLGGAGPAAAQSETFPVKGCLIDAEGELRPADLARLPENAREAIITGEEVPNTLATITCTRSAARETARLACQAFLRGQALQNLNISTFLRPCLIDFEPCTGVREIVEARTNNLVVKNENANACLEQFPNGGPCFSLELRCVSPERG